MTPRLVVLGLCLVLTDVGCSDPTAIAVPTLGIWGDSTIRVTAGPTSVFFALPCSAIQVNEPIRLDSTGSFAFSNVFTLPQINAPARPLNIAGRFVGGHLLLDLTFVSVTPPVTYHYRLQPNVEPSHNFACLAWNRAAPRERGLTWA